MKKLMPSFPLEGLVLIVFLLASVSSALILYRQFSHRQVLLKERAWLHPEAMHQTGPPIFMEPEAAIRLLEHPVLANKEGHGLLVSDLRVVAIGSGYPIPYDAESCPFTGAPQPSLDQLDRDSDGMTDDWELKYGLNKYKTADAMTDLEGDGFSNLEEFRAGTDPTMVESHPPYAAKLRFVRRIEVPFPWIFQGASKLPDGRVVFQLNELIGEKTHFRELGEEVEGIVLERFIPRSEVADDTLYVRRESFVVELPRGEKVADPESQVELINILDRSTKIATMGALLSLRSDVYTVVDVQSDRISVRDHATEKVFDIVGFADGEREAVFEGFEE
jgi:hypothetical protein